MKGLLQQSGKQTEKQQQARKETKEQSNNKKHTHKRGLNKRKHCISDHFEITTSFPKVYYNRTSKFYLNG